MEKEKYPIITEFENCETKIDNLIDELSMIRKFLFWFVLVFVAFSCFVSCFIVNCFSKNIDNNVDAYSNNNEIESYNVTDLTGTIWTINSTNCPPGYGQFNIEGALNSNDNFFKLYIGYTQDFMETPPVLPQSNSIFISSFSYVIQNDVINFTGGTDVTNSNLISWLQSNATPIQTSVTYNIITTLTNLISSGSSTIDSDGTATITLTPNIGYILPTTISVTNADYSYNSTTGVVILSNATDDVVITASGVRYYTITVNLDDGLYGSSNNNYIFTENDNLVVLEFTPFYNNQFSGFVPDFIISYDNNTAIYDYSNLITTEDIFTFSCGGRYEKIYISLSDITSDIEFSINSVLGQSVVGTWYLDYQMYLLSNYNLEGMLFKRVFVSNDQTFVHARRDFYNNFFYDFDYSSGVSVFAFYTGQYLPYDTYNYTLITFDDYNNLGILQNVCAFQNLLRSDDNFFKMYRHATNEDIAHVEFLNSQLVDFNSNVGFIQLFSAILDSQFGTLKSLLNFTIFDINLWSILCLFISLSLAAFVIKFIRGFGGDNPKKGGD